MPVFCMSMCKLTTSQDEVALWRTAGMQGGWQVVEGEVMDIGRGDDACACGGRQGVVDKRVAPISLPKLTPWGLSVEIPMNNRPSVTTTPHPPRHDIPLVRLPSGFRGGWPFTICKVPVNALSASQLSFF